MSKGAYVVPAIIAVLSLSLFAGPANALSEKECSAKYQSAKKAGAVGSTTWNEFRKAECGPEASMQLKTVNVAPAAEVAGPSIEECSVRYQSAKAANTLGNLTWNEFRKAGCTVKAAAAEAVLPKEAAAQSEPAESAKVSERECSARYRAAKDAGILGERTWNQFRKGGCPTTTAQAAGTMVPTMGSIFPIGIAPKYAALHAGKARRMTCLDQYRANKAAGVSQVRWIKKGGGYYSECNKRLKQR
jgi:hypothetical protein